MSALGYLLRTRLKNAIKQFIRDPRKRLMAIFVLAMLALVIYASSLPREVGDAYRPRGELYALAFALYAFIYCLTASKGLGKGVSLFSMADVNAAFTAPLDNRSILLYGLLQQMATSLTMGAFLIFQYGWLSQSYGVDAPLLLLILFGYALALFLGQITALALYILRAGSARRGRICAWVCGCALGAWALYLVWRGYAAGENWLDALVETVNGSVVTAFPVAGWLRGMLAGFAEGDWTVGLALLGACAAFGALATLLATRLHADYYEDVLQATETSFAALSAKREGKLNDILPENVKLGHTGLGRGEGAQAFAAKHALESRRARRFLLDTTTLIFLAVNVVYSLFMRQAEFAFVAVFAFTTYMQLFSVATGRWTRELLLPYVFLVPDTAFRKLINCLRESMLKLALEAVLTYAIVGPLLGLSVAETAAAMLARFSFALLFTAGNLLVERMFGSVRSKGLVFALYFAVLLLLCAPAIGLAIGAAALPVTALSQTLRVLLAASLANLPVAFGVFFLSRNLLATAELSK